MLPEILYETSEVLQAKGSFPCVSIILPFEPKMTPRKELELQLKQSLAKVEADLALTGAPAAQTVMDKIYHLTKSINYSTYKKSLALFASPLLEKIYYLNIPVEEKIIVDQSFEIRDLVYSKKEIHKYLVMVLNSRQNKIFLGNTSSFIRILCTSPASTGILQQDLPEKVSNFTTTEEIKEITLEKFLRHSDNSLGVILNAYNLPLFIMGPEKVVGHFRKLSKYQQRITGIVTGNFEDASENEIRTAIAPQVANWNQVKQVAILHHLFEANIAGKISKGIRKVWKAASEKQGKLLVVEKNYICPARFSESTNIINPDQLPEDLHPLIKDAVDDVIEKVLAGGGDVEFVDTGILSDYEHIALIRYY